jgi:hypothetical protein
MFSTREIGTNNSSLAGLFLFYQQAKGQENKRETLLPKREEREERELKQLAGPANLSFS